MVYFLLNWAKLAALIRRRQRHRLWWGLVGVKEEWEQRVWAVGKDA